MNKHISKINKLKKHVHCVYATGSMENDHLQMIKMIIYSVVRLVGVWTMIVLCNIEILFIV